MSQQSATTTDSWVPADSFGARLTLLRKGLGNLSITEVAKLCDLDDGSWSNWERGTKPRDFEAVVAKIVAATHIDRGWLAWGAEFHLPPYLASVPFDGLAQLALDLEGQSRPRPVLVGSSS